MKIFLDTADTDTIRKYFETGLVDGVTTNPTLIMKSGRNPDDVYQELSDMGVNDISMEVMGNAQEMLTEGIRLSDKFGPVTCQGSMYRDGFAHVGNYQKKGLRLMLHSSSLLLEQFLLRSRATYVSPL